MDNVIPYERGVIAYFNMISADVIILEYKNILGVLKYKVRSILTDTIFLAEHSNLTPIKEQPKVELMEKQL